jgi:hypothetical protein
MPMEICAEAFGTAGMARNRLAVSASRTNFRCFMMGTSVDESRYGGEELSAMREYSAMYTTCRSLRDGKAKGYAGSYGMEKRKEAG